MASYRDFLDALGERESGGDYGVVNSYGYLGKYQFGELALIDVGYYTADGTAAMTGSRAPSPARRASARRPISSPTERRRNTRSAHI
jgi:hypothetical protein